MRKALRRSSLALALIGASVLFLGAAPGVASAANCSVTETPTAWQAAGNYLYFGSQLYGCSDVDQITIYRVTGGSTCNTDQPWHYCNVAWQDYSQCSGGCEHVAPTPTNADQVFCTGVSLLGCANTWYIHPWCGGQTHNIRTQYVFSIHGQTSHLWGPLHYRLSGTYAIVC